MRLISDVVDFGDAAEIQLDGTCGIHRVSANTVCVEFYANKIIDGKVQRVVVLRCRWDRSSWLAEQEMTGRLVMEVLATQSAVAVDEAPHIH